MIASHSRCEVCVFMCFISSHTGFVFAATVLTLVYWLGCLAVLEPTCWGTFVVLSGFGAGVLCAGVTFVKKNMCAVVVL